MRRNYLIVRVALLVAIVIAGILFHHQGATYATIRVVYLVAIVGFLIWRVGMRSGRNARLRNRDFRRGPGDPPSD